MSKMIHLLTAGFQIALTFIATFCIYMVFALLDSDFGLDGLFGLFIVQPVIAVILSMLTVIVCAIAGLPIRLNKKLNRWWTNHFHFSLIGAACGLTLLFLALLPPFRESVTVDGAATLKQIPNITLSCAGWLLTAFSLLHLYPPRRPT